MSQHHALTAFTNAGTASNIFECERALQCRRDTEQRKYDIQEFSYICVLSLPFAQYVPTLGMWVP